MISIENVAIQYIEGTLSEDEKTAFEAHLEQSAEARQVLEELQELYALMDSKETPAPSADLDDRFFNLLENTIAKEQAKPLVQIQFQPKWLYGAAAAILLLLGFGFGQWAAPRSVSNPEVLAIQKEIEKTKQLVLLSLRKESASERLQAVHFTSDLTEADNELLYALIHTMSFDNSLNVQIRATEALAKFADNPLVKDSFIKMLQQTDAPEMQLLLIDLLVKNDTQEALEEMYNLYEQEDLPEIVKTKIRTGIETLSI